MGGKATRGACCQRQRTKQEKQVWPSGTGHQKVCSEHMAFPSTHWVQQLRARGQGSGRQQTPPPVRFPRRRGPISLSPRAASLTLEQPEGFSLLNGGHGPWDRGMELILELFTYWTLGTRRPLFPSLRRPLPLHQSPKCPDILREPVGSRAKEAAFRRGPDRDGRFEG